jgi:hypothetical protein
MSDVEVPPRPLKTSEGELIFNRVLGTVERVDEAAEEAGEDGAAEEEGH